MSKFRLAALASHPIQYQVPLFKKLASHPDIDLTVYFCGSDGLTTTYERDFETAYRWDIPLLDGYVSRFLKNLSPFSKSQTFWKLMNLGIVREIFRNESDAVWIHGYSTLTAWLAALTASVVRTPILLRGESNRLQERDRLPIHFKREALSFLFRKVTAFLSIGTLNADFYKSYGVPEKRIYSCPYTVDNEFFLKHRDALQGERAQLRRAYGVSSENTVILYVGKLVSWKRPLDLVQAFENLGPKNAFLMIVGSGPEYPKLLSYIRSRSLEKVLLLGFKNQTEISRYYVLADLFVLPSEREPWGLVINEAMCFGLPIVATDKVGAAADLVQHGENGFVYPAGDVGKLHELINRLIQDRELQIEMGERSLNLISRWSLNETVKGIVAACSDIRRRKNSEAGDPRARVSRLFGENRPSRN